MEQLSRALLAAVPFPRREPETDFLYPSSLQTAPREGAVYFMQTRPSPFERSASRPKCIRRPLGWLRGHARLALRPRGRTRDTDGATMGNSRKAIRESTLFRHASPSRSLSVCLSVFLPRWGVQWRPLATPQKVQVKVHDIKEKMSSNKREIRK